MRQLGRRDWFGIAAGAAALAACSASGPDQAEALEQIASRIRASFGVGEKSLANLTYKRGMALDDGRYGVFVDYDLISTMPEMGLFNVQMRSGERAHFTDERYVFSRSSTGWTLE